MSALVVSLLLLSLTGCASIRTAPPAIGPEWFRPCDRPSLEGGTWGDVAVLALQERQALEGCSDRLAHLQQILEAK